MTDIKYADCIPVGLYPQLEAVIRYGRTRGLTGEWIESDVESVDLFVKAYMNVAGTAICVGFCAMSTADDLPYEGYWPTDIGWDAYDSETTGSLLGGHALVDGAGGIGKTAEEAVNQAIAWLVAHDIVQVGPDGIVTELPGWEERKRDA